MSSQSTGVHVVRCNVDRVGNSVHRNRNPAVVVLPSSEVATVVVAPAFHATPFEQRTTPAIANGYGIRIRDARYSYGHGASAGRIVAKFTREILSPTFHGSALGYRASMETPKAQNRTICGAKGQIFRLAVAATAGDR